MLFRSTLPTHTIVLRTSAHHPPLKHPQLQPGPIIVRRPPFSTLLHHHHLLFSTSLTLSLPPPHANSITALNYFGAEKGRDNIKDTPKRLFCPSIYPSSIIKPSSSPFYSTCTSHLTWPLLPSLHPFLHPSLHPSLHTKCTTRTRNTRLPLVSTHHHYETTNYHPLPLPPPLPT